MISVVIPTYNNCRLLQKAISSVVRQDMSPDSFEIVVVDSNSTDGTRQVCQEVVQACPRHQIRYSFESMSGLLAARHRGASEANGDLLVFIDEDLEVDSGWLSAIQEAFVDPGVHLVGGKSIPAYEVPPPSWVEYLWARKAGTNICGAYSLVDLGDRLMEMNPNYVWGLNFGIRKKSLIDLGGFHPDVYPRQYQRFQGDGETGLTRKVREKGLKAVYQPRALVKHLVSQTRMTHEYLQKRSYYQGVCDSYALIRKNRHMFCPGESSSLPERLLVVGDSLEIKLLEMLREARRAMRMFLETREKSSLALLQHRAYHDGFRFHQNEVRRDPKLLAWVLKPDYFDYNIGKYQLESE